jgi:hypothetical protein
LHSAGKSAFDQLYRFFDAHFAADGQQKMNMIWHHDEVMDLKLAGYGIGTQHFYEEHRVAL